MCHAARGRSLAVIALALLLGACASPAQTPTSDKPQLIYEETLPAPSITPLILLSPTQTGQVVLGATPSPVTTQSRARLRTATPPDTFTPTITDTVTHTPIPTESATRLPTRTFTPSITPTFTATFTPTITPISSHTSAFGVVENCPFNWFFTPSPGGCPLTAPVMSEAAMQLMQGGRMIWVQNGATIFILFDDQTRQPAWMFAPDTYSEGEDVTRLGESPPPGYLQPQRGFGKLWHDSVMLRERLGWASAPELSFVTFIQADAMTGIRYLMGAQGEIYGLGSDGSVWRRIQ